MSATQRLVMLTVGLMLLGAGSASAQPRRRAVVVVPRVQVYRPFVYDPFWGPWYPYSYGYGYAYPYTVLPQADIKTEITPKGAEVYVDGYYAGHANDFDGVFKRLHVAPGGHAITFHLQGFRTVTENVYVRPDSTLKMNTTMERLAAGETSAPVPSPINPPARDRRSPGT
jgi:PEGA domain